MGVLVNPRNTGGSDDRGRDHALGSNEPATWSYLYHYFKRRFYYRTLLPRFFQVSCDNDTIQRRRSFPGSAETRWRASFARIFRKKVLLYFSPFFLRRILLMVRLGDAKVSLGPKRPVEDLACTSMSKKNSIIVLFSIFFYESCTGTMIILSHTQYGGVCRTPYNCLNNSRHF